MTVADAISQILQSTLQCLNWAMYIVWAIWLVTMPILTIGGLFFDRQVKLASAYLWAATFGGLLSSSYVQKTINVAFSKVEHIMYAEVDQRNFNLSSGLVVHIDPQKNHTILRYKAAESLVPPFDEFFTQIWLYIISTAFCITISLLFFGLIFSAISFLISAIRNRNKYSELSLNPLCPVFFLIGSALIPMIPTFILLMRFSS
jgi:hypothetical protein